MTNQNNEKSKNGKRIALILLALLLIAAIAFGAYTYSKYVSSGNGSGSASVAMWGYTVTVGDAQDTADTDQFFATSYKADGTEAGASDATIIANVRGDTTDLVAPGANGSVTITISGTSEVNAELSMLIEDGFKDVYITVSKGQETLYYNPILFTLTGGPEGNTVDFTNVTLAQLKAKLGAAENPLAGVIESSNSITATYTLSWAWAFEASETGNTLFDEDGAVVNTYKFAQSEIDILDTVLGQLSFNANGSTDDITLAATTITDSTAGTPGTWTIETETRNTDYSVDISFDLKVSITQVDTAITQTP